MHDAALIDWIGQRASQAELVLSVCTGALLLAKAGLLEGLSATTHHGALDLLRKVAPNTTVLRRRAHGGQRPSRHFGRSGRGHRHGVSRRGPAAGARSGRSDGPLYRVSLAAQRARETVRAGRAASGRFRQVDRKGAALAERAVDGDAAVVGLHDVLDDRESQAGASQLSAAGPVDAIEAFEDPREVFLGDPRPVVGDADRDLAVARFGRRRAPRARGSLYLMALSSRLTTACSSSRD